MHGWPAIGDPVADDQVITPLRNTQLVGGQARRASRLAAGFGGKGGPGADGGGRARGGGRGRPDPGDAGHGPTVVMSLYGHDFTLSGLGGPRSGRSRPVLVTRPVTRLSSGCSFSVAPLLRYLVTD